MISNIFFMLGIYIILPILFLIIFYNFAIKWAVVSLPICIILELILFLDAFIDPESIPILLYFTVMQVIFFGFISLVVSAQDN